jgi:hypothetical protein
MASTRGSRRLFDIGPREACVPLALFARHARLARVYTRKGPRAAT